MHKKGTKFDYYPNGEYFIEDRGESLYGIRNKKDGDYQLLSTSKFNELLESKIITIKDDKWDNIIKRTINA